MSAAMKCDICGRFYENYDYDFPSEDSPNGIRFVTTRTSGNIVRTWEIKDCCPECMDYILSTILKLKGKSAVSD